VNVFACGALVPEAIAASDALLKEGILANVFNVTGPGPLYRDFQLSRTQAAPGEGEECHLERLVPGGDRAAPAVTVIDDHPHALAWIGGALGSKVYPLGVTRFGQSGSVAELYAEYGVGAENIAATCRRALKSAMPSPALKMSGRIP
jgi:pyruvate dehydrogenase E1 component